MQHAVEPVTHQRAVTHGLDVHVAGVSLQCLKENEINQSNDGTFAAGVEQVGITGLQRSTNVGFGINRRFIEHCLIEMYHGHITCAVTRLLHRGCCIRIVNKRGQRLRMTVVGNRGHLALERRRDVPHCSWRRAACHCEQFAFPLHPQTEQQMLASEGVRNTREKCSGRLRATRARADCLRLHFHVLRQHGRGITGGVIAELHVALCLTILHTALTGGGRKPTFAEILEEV